MTWALQGGHEMVLRIIVKAKPLVNNKILQQSHSATQKKKKAEWESNVGFDLQHLAAT